MFEQLKAVPLWEKFESLWVAHEKNGHDLLADLTQFAFISPQTLRSDTRQYFSQTWKAAFKFPQCCLPVETFHSGQRQFLFRNDCRSFVSCHLLCNAFSNTFPHFVPPVATSVYENVQRRAKIAIIDVGNCLCSIAFSHSRSHGSACVSLVHLKISFMVIN